MNNEENNIRKKFFLLKMLTKYGIFGMVVLGAIHCTMLWFGIDAMVVHVLAVVFAYILGLSLSRLFGLCTIHKLAVLYICLLLLCIVLRRHGVLAEHVQLHRLVMAIVGSLITLAFLWKAVKNYSKR